MTTKTGGPRSSAGRKRVPAGALEARTFASRLAWLRADAGLSLYALAIRADMNRAHLMHLERGTKRPTLDVAARVAVALGYPLAVWEGLDTLPKKKGRKSVVSS